MLKKHTATYDLILAKINHKAKIKQKRLKFN